MGTPPGPTTGVGGGGGMVPGVEEEVILATCITGVDRGVASGVDRGVGSVERLFNGVEIVLPFLPSPPSSLLSPPLSSLLLGLPIPPAPL